MSRAFAAGFALLLALSLVAFWPRYFALPFAKVDGYAHVHAAFAFAWFALLIAQPLLVASRKLALHRRVGSLAWALGPGVFVSAILLAHHRFAAMDEKTFAAETAFLYLPLGVGMLFIVAWAGGLAWRSVTAVHARFMAATGLTLIDPVLGRVLGMHVMPDAHPLAFQAITFALTDALFVALVLTLPKGSPGRLPLVAVLALFAAVHAGWFTLAQGPAWAGFADFFRRLPLT